METRKGGACTPRASYIGCPVLCGVRGPRLHVLRHGVALAGPLVREATVMHLVVTRDHRVKVRKPIRLIVAGTTVRRACQQK